MHARANTAHSAPTALPQRSLAPKRSSSTAAPAQAPGSTGSSLEAARSHSAPTAPTASAHAARAAAAPGRWVRSLGALGRAWRELRSPSQETVRTNAFRFVRTVSALSKEHRVVELHSYPAPRKCAPDAYGWELMCNHHWRELVLDQLNRSGVRVKAAAFYPPDSMEDWSFIAISTASRSRLQELTLEDLV